MARIEVYARMNRRGQQMAVNGRKWPEMAGIEVLCENEQKRPANGRKWAKLSDNGQPPGRNCQRPVSHLAGTVSYLAGTVSHLSAICQPSVSHLAAIHQQTSVRVSQMAAKWQETAAISQ